MREHDGCQILDPVVAPWVKVGTTGVVQSESTASGNQVDGKTSVAAAAMSLVDRHPAQLAAKGARRGLGAWTPGTRGLAAEYLGPEQASRSIRTTACAP